MSSLYEIPKSWEWTTLNEVFLIERGGSPRPIKSFITDADDGINWIKIGDVKKGQKYVESTQEKIKPEGLKKSRLVIEGDFILSNSMSFGRPYIVKTQGAIHDGWLVFRDMTKVLDKDFFYYLLSSTYIYQQFSLNASGSTVKNLNIEIVKQTNISLPPLNEQKRIVTKIEKLFLNLNKSDQHLIHLEKQLKRYRQSVLKSAFEGELTREWRELNKINFDFSTEKIGNICDCIVPNRDKPKTFTGNIKWITTPILKENSILIDYENADMGLTKEEVLKYKAKVIPVNSVVMTCVGTFGLSSVVSEIIVINQQLHAFLPSPKLNNKYIAYCIKKNKRYFEKNATATTIQYLNKKKCNAMPIPTISLEEQNEIVKQIEKHLSIIDKLETVVQKSIKESKRLRQSILKQAFEGKLVEEDSNDESATMLLEKIAKAKEEYKKEMKKGKKK